MLNQLVGCDQNFIIKRCSIEKDVKPLISQCAILHGFSFLAEGNLPYCHIAMFPLFPCISILILSIVWPCATEIFFSHLTFSLLRPRVSYLILFKIYTMNVIDLTNILRAFLFSFECI